MEKYEIGEKLIWHVIEEPVPGWRHEANIDCVVTRIEDDYAVAEGDNMHLLIDDNTEHMFIRKSCNENGVD